MNNLPNSMTLGSHPCNSEVDGYQNVNTLDIAEALEIDFKDVQAGSFKGTVHFGLTEVYVAAKYHYSPIDMGFKIDSVYCTISGNRMNSKEYADLIIDLEDELIEAYEKECKKNPGISFHKHLIETMNILTK